AFIPQTSTVIFDGSSGDSTISGSTTFYNLTCTVAGKQLIFEASTTQTIITGGTLTLKGEAGYGNLLVLRSTKSDDPEATPAEKEWLINHQGSEDILFVDVKDSHNTNASNLITADKTRNAGNNTNWEFLTNLLTWTGTKSGGWTNGENWDLGFFPNYGDSIIILSAPYDCTANENKTLMDIEIRQQGVLDLDGKNLTLIGGFRNEAGTLKLKGSEALVGFNNDIDSGTVEYTGSWTYLGFNGGEEYFNLNFSGTGTYSLNAALIVNNDLTITNGTLNTGIKPMNIGGSFSNSSHLTAIGVVTFTSTEADETIKLGGSSFYNLVFDGAGGVWKVVDDSLIVDKNLSITRGTLDLNGQNFTLRADEPIFSNQGRLKLTGAETLTNFINDSDSGTVEYYGNSIYDNGLIAGDNYFDLEFSGGGNYSIDSALTVNHQLFLSNLLAVLDSKGYNLTLTSGVPLSNQGTLRLIGQETLTNFVNDTDSGTIEYYGTATYPYLIAGNNYYNLKFSGGGRYELTGNLDINGSLTFVTASLWVEGYSHRKTIIVDRDKVAAGLNDYPLLFSVIDPDLKDTINGGSINPAGYDIVFTDAQGNRLDCQIEKYDGGQGELIAWVRVPTLSKAENTAIYVFYGNPQVASSQNISSVWDSNYAGVWHLGEADSSQLIVDSSGNGNDGVAYGGLTQGA
ncbi:MAG: DUF2341 domain-containing protein, partial [Candidatus Omnitrophica bacterium]|nr:DUF2341 domain-containing protein [Candidatus Omnitrophota bacterium]